MFRNAILLFLIAVLGLPDSTPAQGTEPEMPALTAFISALKKDRPVYSTDVLAELATVRGQDQKVLRRQLLAALDGYDVALRRHRKEKTPLWKDAMALRGELSSKRAYKLLEHASAGARAMLESDEKFVVSVSVRQAARHAKAARAEAHDYLLRVMEMMVRRGQEGGETREYGLLVSGHTNRFKVNFDPLYLFFATRDEAFVTEEVREIQRFIVPRVVRQAPAAETVKYAVRQREKTALVRPEFHLVVGVDNLYFTGSNTDLRPCIEASLELLGLPEGQVKWEHGLKFCTEDNGSKNAKDLNPFYGEVAVEAMRLVDEELKKH
jgi:hypothetical protein